MKQDVAMKHDVRLNIAGERVDVCFDGNMVTTKEFPDIPMNYTAPCGTQITQMMLKLICQKKLGLL